MKISATIDTGDDGHELVVATEGRRQTLPVPAKPGGGSAVNGGELLFAALATCFCNDVYREAKKRGTTVHRVHIEVEGEFGGEGEPARNVVYRATVQAEASPEEVEELIRHTDSVAEIQNTLRQGVNVVLAHEPS